MSRYHVIVETSVEQTPRVQQLQGMFDLPAESVARREWELEFPWDEQPFSIGLIVGPSGSGKTKVAQHLWPEAYTRGYEWDEHQAVIEQVVGPACKIGEAVKALSSVGFSSPPAWLRPYQTLSTGEQFRADLARGLNAGQKLLVMDEFTSVVDRIVAQIGSAAIAKEIRRRGLQFVAISCHYDIIEWLCPDWIMDMGKQEFARGCLQRPSIELSIERVGAEWWRLFRQHHYLNTNLNRSAYCFMARVQGAPAAFVAVRHQPHANGGLWMEHRLVCLPDYQGVGIGRALGDYIAGVFVCSGKKYHSTTSHPAVIESRAKSINWRLTRKKALGVKLGSSTSLGTLRECLSRWRLTASFRYVGARYPDAARGFDLPFGDPVKEEKRAAHDQGGEGGSTPTPALQSSRKAKHG